MLTLTVTLASLAALSAAGVAMNHGRDENGRRRSFKCALAAFVAAEMA